MKTQTHPTDKGVTRPSRGQKSLLIWALSLPVFCGLPSTSVAQEQEDRVITERKALRAYPVSSQKKSALLRSIPKAKVVRRASAPRDRMTTPGFDPSAEVPASRPPALPQVAQPKPKAAAKPQTPSVTPPRPVAAPGSPSARSLVRRCDAMALKGLAYTFGADNPSSGGLDCSGAVQYLLRQEGIRDVPRTAYTQYQWLKKKGALNKVSLFTWSKERVASKLRPGDLLFWKGTYNTGKSPNISHVMIYLGQDSSNGKHYMFGASSRKSKGLNGHAVDVYEFVYPRKHGKDNFAGFGSVPGLGR